MPTPAHIANVLPRLPQKPGVYLYRDRADTVLYVGKAKVLRNRVRSYFQPNAQLEPAKRLMVRRVTNLEYIVVDSELEALLLESTLIKKYRPPFNIIFRDDKYYQYIRLTLKDAYPSVETVRRIIKDGSRYFGPYTSGYAVRQTLYLLKKIFPYKRCSEPPSKLCFEAKIGRCAGHDTGPGSRERYREIVIRLMRFLEGDTATILRDLRQQMRRAADRHEFEQAARLRDRIAAIQKITEQQKVVSTRLENEDVIGCYRLSDLAAVNLFQIRRGKLFNHEHFVLQHTKGQSDAGILASFLGQYYAQATDHPPVVVTRLLPDGHADLGRALQLRIVAPSRGQKRQLVRLAEDNAKDYLAQRQREWLSQETRAKLGLDELGRALYLTESLHRIECYDISNIQGTNAVGSMVVFVDGLPKKSNYRKFTIKTVTGSNDYAMLQEILKRRFGHHRTETSPPPVSGGRVGATRGEGVANRQEGWEDPDLIIIDGGKGQLNAALVILRNLRVSIPTIGLAKRQEEIFRPGQKESIRLPRDSEGLFFIQRIRDEAHRFAIGAYRRRHGAAATRSLLDEIPSIGPKYKKILIERFGTVDGIRRANDDELKSVLGKKRARRLREHL